MLTKIKVKLTVFKAKLAYAGKVWQDNKVKHYNQYGACSVIVQFLEFVVWALVTLAVRELVILL